MDKAIYPVVAALRGVLWVMVLFCAALLLAVVLALFVDVVMRNFGTTLLSGLHEATLTAFMVIYFLGLAEVYARRDDIVLSTLSDALPERARAVMYVVAMAVTAIALGIVAYYAGVITMESWPQKTPSLRLPAGLASLPLAIGSAIAAFAYAIETLAGLAWAVSGTRPDYLAPIKRNFPNTGDASEYVS